MKRYSEKKYGYKDEDCSLDEPEDERRNAFASHNLQRLHRRDQQLIKGSHLPFTCDRHSGDVETDLQGDHDCKRRQRKPDVVEDWVKPISLNDLNTGSIVRRLLLSHKLVYHLNHIALSNLRRIRFAAIGNQLQRGRLFFLKFSSEIGQEIHRQENTLVVDHLLKLGARMGKFELNEVRRGGETLNQFVGHLAVVLVPDTKLDMFDFQGAGEREKKKL